VRKKSLATIIATTLKDNAQGKFHSTQMHEKAKNNYYQVYKVQKACVSSTLKVIFYHRERYKCVPYLELCEEASECVNWVKDDTTKVWLSRTIHTGYSAGPKVQGKDERARERCQA
jgi:hypothetical protein